MHSTTNLEDGYLGSGKIVRFSIKKYGKENHSFEILEFSTDRNALEAREKEIVNEKLLEDNLCMNLWVGGTGVQYGAKFSAERKKNMGEAGRKRWEKMTQEQRHLLGEKVKAGWKKRTELGIPRTPKPHSDATKEKIRQALIEKCKRTDMNRGEKNSRAKLFKFVDPENNEYFVKGNKRNFCKIHGLSSKKRDQRGWKIIEL
jgi:hypothetical protein